MNDVDKAMASFKDASSRRKYLEKDLPRWLSNNKKRRYDKPLGELAAYPDSGNVQDLISMDSEFESLTMWHMNSFVASGLKGPPDYNLLALAARCWLTEFLAKEALYSVRKNSLTNYSARRYGLLQPLLIAIGWREQAEAVARIAHEQFTTFLSEGISGIYLPWFMFHLTKDWLQLDVEVRSEWGDLYIKDLGFYDKLLANWRNPNMDEFAGLLHEAGDFHVRNSRYVHSSKQDDMWGPEFEDDTFWLFPVEIFTILRLRIWEGLPNPPLEHPLHSVSYLGQMPPVLPWPEYPAFDEVIRKYRRAYPHMRAFGDFPQ